MKTKRSQILKYLKTGKALSGIVAFQKFNTMSLPQHIFALREQGIDIKSELIKSENLSYSLYWIDK